MNRDLPHDRACLNLYEIQLQERKFLRNEKALSLFLSDPQIEGIYEMKTPLMFRGILKLGCVAKVSNAIDDNKRAYKLNDLEFINVNAHPYLEKSVASFRKIYIYHCFDRSRSSGFGMVALFIIQGNNINNEDSNSEKVNSKAYIWIVNGTGSLESRPPMQRIFRKFCPDENNLCKFTTTFSETMSSAFSSCNDRLASYLRERKGPTIAIVQGSMDNRKWRRALPQLLVYITS